MTQTEENYLKGLFHLSYQSGKWLPIGTNELAVQLHIKPATANSMLKKLKEKKLISYEKYGKITVSAQGKKAALFVIRKHRLWETFLYEKLDFTWDEVHEVAEELEHIQSLKLIEKLEKFLDYPRFDPHGDPIPNSKGELEIINKIPLSQVEEGKTCKMVAVKDNSSVFLKYLVQLGIGLNHKMKVLSRGEFDELTVIQVNGNRHTVSQKFCENIFVV